MAARGVAALVSPLTLLLVLCFPAGAPGDEREVVRIGIADVDRIASVETWAPTAAYLGRRLPAYEFTFEKLSPTQIRERLRRHEIDFVLSDPGLYVELAYEYGVAAIATRRVPGPDGPLTRFGAVVLVRAQQTDINRFTDLRGKALVARPAQFGSFHLVWRELNREGVQPFRDLARLSLHRAPEEKIVEMLRTGGTDAVIVPAGVFERMQARGLLDPAAVRVLEAQPPGADFPYVRSTPLYPEWPLAAAVHAPEPLARAVHSALVAMAPDDPAARAASYAGWSAPLSYEPVGKLYKELRLGPYQREPLVAYARYYWDVVLGIAALVIALAAVALHALRVNRRLADEIRRGARAREQMQMFASAVEQTADAVIITDPQGVIEYVNPAFTRISGYTAEEVRGRTPALLKSGRHDAAFYRRLWDTIRRGEVYAEEFINRRKDGGLYWEQKSIIPLRDADGNIAHYVATGRDITERRRAEEEAQLRREQLAHTARVNIIGEMAASVAHEISQPLTAIINYAHGSMRRLRTSGMEPSRLLEVLEQIVAQAQRVTDAVVTLRRFVARRRPQRVHADVNSLIRQVVALAAGETRARGISIVLELADNLPRASVDDVQIEQVVLNLLRNGAEALASADAAARELKVRTALAEDGSIEVSISDTGPGLPPRLAAKLFEPFFTTKPDGVGLGLAISRSIIETHGGRIWVTPNTERGVTFRFTLPVEAQTHEQ